MKLDANQKLAVKLGGVALLMFGFGYALVPIYNVFCDITGLGGKTGEISVADAARTTVDRERLVTVTFDTNVAPGLPWRFTPAQPSVQVHPGEMGTALFYAENLTGESVVGQAVPSMAPAAASVYFNKTECFCFSRQPLAPGERKAMPVRFIVDPGLPRDIRTMTLSYTFFEVPGEVAGTGGDDDLNKS